MLSINNNHMIQEILFPGIYNPGIASLIKDKVNNKDPVGFTGLMAAIINQARIDALAGDLEAIEWLAGDMAFDLCYALRFNHNNVIAWLENERITL